MSDAIYRRNPDTQIVETVKKIENQISPKETIMLRVAEQLKVLPCHVMSHPLYKAKGVNYDNVVMFTSEDGVEYSMDLTPHLDDLVNGSSLSLVVNNICNLIERNYLNRRLRRVHNG